ncbi:SUKH-4 family immunity protein [Streptomyces hygroscopicus]|uniref:SUKH-4 family immunity protein n=1 Tax=Streptomyces hygroscopicus TaxID=1912 RepID=UPI000825C3EF|nr:SUKH-4 family immunity protein [Streptomyces hygroscopicus]
MSFAVSPDELISTFGLSGVVYFPRYESPHNRLDTRTASFLSSVGLPDEEWFKSKASVGQDESVSLAEWFGPEDGTLPKECQAWLVLGYFSASVIALDPESRKVYAFGEGEPLDSYTQLHRDVESLVYALHLFKKFDDQERDDDAGIEEQVDQLRAQIEDFDTLPFENEQSQWNLILDEVIEGIW